MGLEPTMILSLEAVALIPVFAVICAWKERRKLALKAWVLMPLMFASLEPLVWK